MRFLLGQSRDIVDEGAAGKGSEEVWEIAG